MAGQTIIEKIFQAHSGADTPVKSGDTIWLDLDVRTARDFGGANVVKHFLREWPQAPVARPKQVFFTFDCQAPANTIAYAENQQVCRRFSSTIRSRRVQRVIFIHRNGLRGTVSFTT